MKLETKLKKLINSDIKIVNVEFKLIEVLLPYESNPIEIELEGDTEEERIESFKKGVNYRLGQMINHLEDCKLD